MERQLSKNTRALLNVLKTVNVGDYILRANQALKDGNLDEAAAAVAALANANRGVYDMRRRAAFLTARNYFKYGHGIEAALKRVVPSPYVWDYLKTYLDMANQ